MHPKSIQKLIDLFSEFPTVGPRTAARFVFYLMSLKKEEIEELIKSVLELKEKVKFCKFCFNPFQDAGELCQICSNPSRDKSLLCIVAKENDFDSIEKTRKYKGIYFILGGTVSKLKKESIEKLRTKELEERIKNPEKYGLKADFKEIIMALNSTTEGEATALYLERLIKSFDAAQNKKITRLGRGLPVGGELEYADEETLSSALESRK